MSGHSKWSNIKNRKGAMDAKKAKVFSNLSKLIRIAVKEGNSGDPKSNPSLRLMLDKARIANMPNVNIQRAIERGLGKSASGKQIQEIVYEGFGPHGVGVVIIGLTDNTQRTSAELRSILGKAGGSLGGPNSVMYAFERSSSGEYKPTMPLELDDSVLEQLMNMIDELLANEDVEEVYCNAVLPEDEPEA